MTLASQCLAELKEELGEDLDKLKFLPLQKVRTSSQEDEEEAIPFTIHFGKINYTPKGSKSPTLLDVLVYLFRPTEGGRPASVKFMTPPQPEVDDRFLIHEVYNIGKTVDKKEEAFQGLTSVDTLDAVAKYYFLRKMVDFSTNHAEDETCSLTVSKSLVRGLLSACRKFDPAEKLKESNRRNSIASTGIRPSSKRGIIGTGSSVRRSLARDDEDESYASSKYSAMRRGEGHVEDEDYDYPMEDTYEEDTMPFGHSFPYGYHPGFFPPGPFGHGPYAFPPHPFQDREQSYSMQRSVRDDVRTANPPPRMSRQDRAVLESRQATEQAPTPRSTSTFRPRLTQQDDSSSLREMTEKENELLEDIESIDTFMLFLGKERLEKRRQLAEIEIEKLQKRTKK